MLLLKTNFFYFVSIISLSIIFILSIINIHLVSRGYINIKDNYSTYDYALFILFLSYGEVIFFGVLNLLLLTLLSIIICIYKNIIKIFNYFYDKINNYIANKIN
jgi:hypothetical protein